MASQSSYIKHRPSLLQPAAGLPSAQGACAAPGERGALRSVLYGVTCYFYLMLAFSAQTQPGDFWQDFLIQSVWCVRVPPHTRAHAPLACSSKLLESCAASLKGSELDQLLRKLLRYQYFLNELNIPGGC